MRSLFSARSFAGFGPNRLDATAQLTQLRQVAGKRPGQLRLGIREACGRRPGVYGFLNTQGELIYVGKAKNLRVRLLSYFRGKRRDPRARRIVAETRAIVWEMVPTEFAALLRELELIRYWQPRWNIQGQPARRRRAFLYLGRPTAPGLLLARRVPKADQGCWGPIFGGRRARAAVELLNQAFGLRDCGPEQAMTFADQEELFPIARPAGCIRHEIGTCLGPCTGGVTHQAYFERVQALRRFLDGANSTFLDTLERDMGAASTALDFERAARLRDRLQLGRWLRDHLARIRQARERHTFIYPVNGPDHEYWYFIRQGWVARVTPAPGDDASRQQTAELLHEVFGQARLGIEPSYSEGIDGVLLVSAWFRRHPLELKRTLTPEQARSRCVGR